MIRDFGVERTIRRNIASGDYLRGARARLSDSGGRKEWHHFCLTDPSVDLVVNFSSADDPRGGAEIFRLTCAVHVGRWDGDVDHFDEGDVVARPGRVSMRFGESSFRYDGGAYHVRAQMRRRPVEVDISLHPVTIPSQVNNILLGDGPPLHWFVVPRLLASGHVTVDDQRIDFQNADAYHDHNWGHFSWGQDFCWTWGYGHGVSRGTPWSFVFDRLSDRARNIDLRRGLVLWKAARQHRVWSGRELAVEGRGRFRPAEVLKLPRVMALVEAGAAVEVPQTLRCTGESFRDRLELVFESERSCQFIAPNDGDLGVTVINEVSGPVTLAGSVDGEVFELRGRGMFEFLGG
jgi:hypothetical protein